MNVRTAIDQRIAAALSTCTGVDSPALVQPARKPEFGDYQANGVMAAAKRLKTNPVELAAQVIDTVALDDIAARLETAGPGFINIFLSAEFLATSLDRKQPLVIQVDDPYTVVVDYSSPNLAKEMHVGHIRSTIIGDALALVLERLGHKVIRKNHVGDWGTQFGMLITYLSETGENSEVLEDLEDFYRAAKTRFDADAAFATRSRLAVVGLQGGDPEIRSHWRRFIDISLNHCQALYGRLGVSLSREDVHAESAYNDDLPTVIELLRKQGLLETSDGAQCVFLEEFKGKNDLPLPVIVQKSDGGYLYATTDLAAVRHRRNELKAQRVLYFTDARQALHFKQIFAVARKAGFADPAMSLEHHPFGNMLGKDGKPFKTREGGVLKLAELLDEAETRAFELVSEKNPDLAEDERREIARVVGIGAVKYADLSKNRTSDYHFDWDQMLAFEGNTAPYLQYAYTRVQSVFRRGNIDVDSLTGEITPQEPDERTLAVKLLRFQEVLEQVAADAYPHYLCTYLYELASQFMRFYEACPVLSAPGETRVSRLLLCERVAETLKNGLGLLGIETVERM
ncbi:MAG: arginine--tRNA ligase [Gammaproteobacteria bacterium]|nr:arginine--tRNA ligase [Gammaproteobacteria bacterium]